MTSKNLSVANYDALLAEIATQKELTRTIAAAKEDSGSLDCTDHDTAKASLSGFGDAFRQEIDAIQAYKTAIKNLVTAVRTAAKEAGNAQQ